MGKFTGKPWNEVQVKVVVEDEVPKNSTNILQRKRTVQQFTSWSIGCQNFELSPDYLKVSHRIIKSKESHF